MALINQNVLFDRLQLYINNKIDGIEVRFEELFNEYGLKIIVANINQIGTVADNIEAILGVYQGVDEIITIVETPGLIDAILMAETNALKAESEAWESEAEAMTADNYATEAFGQEVMEYVSDGDGSFTPVPTGMESAFSYAVQAFSASTGFKFQGVWDIGAHTDPLTEPPAPQTLEDPNNPGNPLPYQDGMYWIVEGDSIYDPNGDSIIDPYPTFGPVVGQYGMAAYKTGDQIIYIDTSFIEDPNNPGTPANPYTPWMKKRDLVAWDRIVGEPRNVASALSYLGTSLGVQPGNKMLGNLLIEKADPTVMIKNEASTDNVFATTVDSNGSFKINRLDDNFLPSAGFEKVEITRDALKILLSVDGIRYGGAKVWTDANDGDGSGLDADLLDGRDHTAFLEKFKIENPNFDLLTGDQLCTIENMATPLFGATKGTLLVEKKANFITQLFYSGNVLLTRESGDNGGTWSPWKQYGSMTFDQGTGRLDIILPV